MNLKKLIITAAMIPIVLLLLGHGPQSAQAYWGPGFGPFGGWHHHWFGLGGFGPSFGHFGGGCFNCGVEPNSNCFDNCGGVGDRCFNGCNGGLDDLVDAVE